MKRPIALTLAMLMTSPTGAWALDGNKAAYVGGTIRLGGQGDEPIEGRLDIGPDRLVFWPARRLQTAALVIDYSSIRGPELGQTAERRLPLVAGALVLLGPFGLPSLSARRRVHYLTLVYADDQGRNQVAVMALGKNLVHPTLRSGHCVSPDTTGTAGYFCNRDSGRRATRAMATLGCRRIDR